MFRMRLSGCVVPSLSLCFLLCGVVSGQTPRDLADQANMNAMLASDEYELEKLRVCGVRNLLLQAEMLRIAGDPSDVRNVSALSWLDDNASARQAAGAKEELAILRDEQGLSAWEAGNVEYDELDYLDAALRYADALQYWQIAKGFMSQHVDLWDVVIQMDIDLLDSDFLTAEEWDRAMGLP